MYPNSLVANSTTLQQPTAHREWEKQQIERVAGLSDHEVLQELKQIMLGYNYSWHTISRYLQMKLDNDIIHLAHFENGNIPYEWNVLCDEKVSWQRYGRPSFRSFKSNKACLINLKTIPTQTGIGIWAATRNLDFKLRGKLSVDKVTGKNNEEFRGCNGYFYADGPEFRLEYIHDRVEE